MTNMANKTGDMAGANCLRMVKFDSAPVQAGLLS